MDYEKINDDSDISDEAFKEMRSFLYQSTFAKMSRIAKGALNVAENLKEIGNNMEKSNEYILEVINKTDDCS